MSEPEHVHRAAPHHRPPRHAQPRARLVPGGGGGGLVAGEVVQLRLADPAANMSDGELAVYQAGTWGGPGASCR